MSLEEPLGIGRSGCGGEGRPVDCIAPVARQGDCPNGLGRRGAGLSELASDSREMDHIAGPRGPEHRAHPQKQIISNAHLVRIEFREALGAVAALEDDGFAIGCFSKRRSQVDDVGNFDERFGPGEALLDALKRGSIGIVGDLLSRARTPARRRPFRPQTIGAWWLGSRRSGHNLVGGNPAHCVGDWPAILGGHRIEHAKLALWFGKRLRNDCDCLADKGGANRMRKTCCPADRRRRAEVRADPGFQ